MPCIAHYPRRGDPVAPRLLRDFLEEPVPQALLPDGVEQMMFNELDVSIWEKASPGEVAALAQELSRFMTGCLPEIRRNMRDVTLAEAGAAGKSTLVVGQRVRNALAREGLLSSIDDFCSATIGDILRMRAFGATCLLDLLVALETPNIVPYEPSLVLHEPGLETVMSQEYATLEEEIAAAVEECAASERNAQILIARLGMWQHSGETLDHLGGVYGLTRERIRQVESKILKRISGTMFSSLPRLDSVIELVVHRCPLVQKELDELLRQNGLTETGFSLGGIVACAAIFRDAEFTLARVDEVEFLVQLGFEGEVVTHFAKATSIAKKRCSSAGTTTVADVAARLAESQNVERLEDVERIVRLAVGAGPFVWLDEQAGWFWRPRSRNRLMNNIMRVLSVTSPVDARELRRTVRRDYRMGGYAPPARILVAFAYSSSKLSTDGRKVWAAEQVSRESALSATERAAVQVLEKGGGVLSSADFEREFLATGHRLPGFQRVRGYSPVIRRYVPGVYGHIGATPSAEKLERLQVRPPKRRLLEDCGWTEDGKVWLSYTLSDAGVSTGVLSVPASLQAFVEGEYELLTPGKESVGYLVARDYSCWGLGHCFRRLGAETGDSLLLLLDLETRKVTVFLGDEDLVEDVLDD